MQSRKRINFSFYLDIFFVFSVIYLCSSLVLIDQRYDTERIIYLLFASISYCVFSCLFKYRILRRLYLVILLIIAYFETSIVFLQICGLLKVSNGFFIFGGSFGNPGLAANFLCLIFPYLLSAWFVYERFFYHTYKYWVLCMCMIMMLYVIICSGSRSSWIALLISTIYTYYRYNKKIYDSFICLCKKSKWFSSIIGIAVSGLLLLLYNFKPLSAFGRFFIWKIILLYHHSNYWLGEGISSFSVNYGKWQADYFLNRDFLKIEEYVAGYVTSAYNEFLEIYIEQGCCGLLVLIIIFYCTLQIKDNNLFDNIGAKSSVIAFISLCLFTSPFHSYRMLCIFVASSALLSAYYTINRMKINKVGPIKIFVVVTCILCSLPQLLKYAKGLHHLYQGQQFLSIGNNKKGIDEFSIAYSYIPNNPSLLFFYGSALFNAGLYNQSLVYFEKAIEKSSDPNLYLLLGDNYAKFNRFFDAEKSYKISSAIIPTRIMPKYKIVTSLLAQGREEEAVELAEKILSIEPKIPSILDNDIRNELKKLIAEIKLSN